MEAWPVAPRSPDWMKTEPPGLNDIAKRFRIGLYQRVRTSGEAKIAVHAGHGVALAISITNQFVDACEGRITLPEVGEPMIGDHMVTLCGVGENHFRFSNSWGRKWGDDGFGYLPITYVDRHLVDAFVCQLPVNTQFPEDPKTDISGWAVVGPLQDVVHGIEVWNRSEDEREGWALVVERDGLLDIEDIFVRPAYRRKGVGQCLVRLLRRLSKSCNLPLRCCVSHVDAVTENLPAVHKIISRLGLRAFPVQLPWATFAAARTESDAVAFPSRGQL